MHAWRWARAVAVAAPFCSRPAVSLRTACCDCATSVRGLLTAAPFEPGLFLGAPFEPEPFLGPPFEPCDSLRTEARDVRSRGNHSITAARYHEASMTRLLIAGHSYFNLHSPRML